MKLVLRTGTETFHLNLGSTVPKANDFVATFKSCRERIQGGGAQSECGSIVDDKRLYSETDDWVASSNYCLLWGGV